MVSSIKRDTLFLGILLVAFYFVGCASHPSKEIIGPKISSTELNQLLPVKESGRIVDEHLREGLIHLNRGDCRKASRSFNRALRFEPQNSYLNFLNGLTYHLMAVTTDSGQYPFAETGYELALQFDPNNYLAAQQLALIDMKNRRYGLAQERFAHALLYKPDHVPLLYGLAAASYYAQDLRTAAASIIRAEELKPSDPGILYASTLIRSAVGQMDKAEAAFSQYSSIETNTRRINKLSKRMGEWRSFHKAMGGIIIAQNDDDDDDDENGNETDDVLGENATSEGVTAGQSDDTDEEEDGDGDDDENEAPDQVKRSNRMVIVDVIIIRHEDMAMTGKGVNLLQGLQIQYGGQLDYSRTRDYTYDLLPKPPDLTVSGKDVQRVLTHTVGVPTIIYSLNIFNSGLARNEIIARPTLIALDGVKSEFFSGSVQHIALTGNDVSNLVALPVGVRLEVIPNFISDDTIKLSVLAARAYYETDIHGTFNQTVKTSKTFVTSNVVLKFGQTLMLSGLSEKETEEVKSGVPFLQNIPGIQYLFSREETLDLNKSVLILLTPRKPVEKQELESAAPETNKDQEPPSIKTLRDRHAEWFEPVSNIHPIITHLKKHRFFREFRHGDLVMEPWWGRPPQNLKDILLETLSFLYF